MRGKRISEICFNEGTALITLAVMLTLVQPAFAQVAIQQPVVGTTSVNTTVTVPDRGATYLGGSSSAVSGRAQYGPIRSGTSTGLSRQSTSISTSVRVIDLQAMDEAILNSRRVESDRPRQLSSINRPRPFPERNVATEPNETVSPAAKVAQHERLALAAEESRKMGVAKLHWRMAAKYGSKLAETRLTELSLQ